MVHPDTRSDRRRRRREAEILDAAEGLLETHGPDALTMARVAAAVDGAVGALYRYFPSKDALLAALQARAVTALDERVARAFAEARDPVVGLVGGLRAWREFLEASAARAWLVDGIVAEPRALVSDAATAPVVRAIEPLLARVATALGAAAAAGHLSPGDPLERTLVLWSCLHGLGRFRKLARLDPTRLDPTRLERAALTTLFLGFGADPGVVAAAFPDSHGAEVQGASGSLRPGADSTEVPR